MLPIMNRNSWLPEVFNDLFENDFTPRNVSTAPAINVKETQTAYTVELAAPGLKKEDFMVNINAEGNLVVKMEQHDEKKDEDKNSHYLRREFSFSKFEQTLILPDDVDKEGITAKMAHGLLTVTLPKVVKTETKVSRTIDIC